MSLLTDGDRILIVVAHDDDAILMGSSLLSTRCRKRLFVFTFSDAVGGTEQQCAEAYRGVENLEIRTSGLAASLDMDVRVRRFLIEACMEEIADFSPTILLTNNPSDRHHDHRSVWTIVDQCLFHISTWKQGDLPRFFLSGEVIHPMPDPTFVLPAAVELKTGIMQRFDRGRADFPWLATNLALNKFRAFQFGRAADFATEAFHVHGMQAIP